MSRQHVLTRKLPFNRELTLDRVKIEKPNNWGRATMTHVKRSRVEECSADFVLEIDYDGLVKQLFRRAAHSKGGKAQVAGGLVRLTKRAEKIVRAKENDHLIPEGWTEAKP